MSDGKKLVTVVAAGVLGLEQITAHGDEKHTHEHYKTEGFARLTRAETQVTSSAMTYNASQMLFDPSMLPLTRPEVNVVHKEFTAVNTPAPE